MFFNSFGVFTIQNTGCMKLDDVLERTDPCHCQSLYVLISNYMTCTLHTN